jgi:hypothetical protein
VGYGNEQPNDEDVHFEYGLALDAARGLHALAAQVRTAGGDRQTAAQTARHDWTGPKRELFDQKLHQEATDTTTVADALAGTARAIAGSWAKARGQQDRINTARWIQAELDKDGALENAWEWTWFGKEDDYGPPPQDPPVPEPPHFSATRCPLHADYEKRVSSRA